MKRSLVPQGAVLRPIVIYQMKQSYIIVDRPHVNNNGSSKKICAWADFELPHYPKFAVFALTNLRETDVNYTVNLIVDGRTDGLTDDARSHTSIGINEHLCRSLGNTPVTQTVGPQLVILL